MVIQQFDVYLVSLDPTIGSEISKTRPCVVISPNEMNTPLNTVIIAPLTRTRKNWPTRHPITFAGKEGEIALDQIRTISKKRLIKHLGRIPNQEQTPILSILQAMFS